MSLALVSLLGTLVAVILASRGRSLGRSAFIFALGFGAWMLIYGRSLY
jgi:hypothetical protein